MRRRFAALGIIAALVATGSPAQSHEAAARCRQLGLLYPVCVAVDSVEQGAARTGVSAADYTDDGVLEIDLTDFAFAPRIVQVFDGQRIIFRNRNRFGGNRHSLASSDYGSDQRVLPIPGGGFGGGRAFQSGVLQPGESFIFDVRIATMDPRGYLPTGLGDQLIGFHCYIHGASQMSGVLRVLPRA